MILSGTPDCNSVIDLLALGKQAFAALRVPLWRIRMSVAKIHLVDDRQNRHFKQNRPCPLPFDLQFEFSIRRDDDIGRIQSEFPQRVDETRFQIANGFQIRQLVFRKGQVAERLNLLRESRRRKAANPPAGRAV